jgi:hypothetical protein
MREVICLILPHFEKSVEFGRKNKKTGIVGKVRVAMSKVPDVLAQSGILRMPRPRR